ncbi:hypothetical protein U1Q18_046054 [Sarracenia purpurea var. burkii]
MVLKTENEGMKFDGNSPEIFWSFVVDLQTLVEGIDGVREYESYRYTFRTILESTYVSTAAQQAGTI